MFEHYLPNKNESAIIVLKSKFHELNKALVSYQTFSHGLQPKRTACSIYVRMQSTTITQDFLSPLPCSALLRSLPLRFARLEGSSIHPSICYGNKSLPLEHERFAAACRVTCGTQFGWVLGRFFHSPPSRSS